MLEEIRSQFPALSARVYGKPLVYLDNAATAQRPLSVTECWRQLTQEKNANIHRAVHYLAGVATQAYEDTREQVRLFLNAASRELSVAASRAAEALAGILEEEYLPSYVIAGERGGPKRIALDRRLVVWL